MPMFDPAAYTARFEREHGFTEAEWQAMLPGAVAPHPWRLGPGAQACVTIGDGRLELGWTVLAPRRIALLRMPRLAVHYRFIDVADDERIGFMRRFDRYTQRGGG